jgi:membrane protein implicated in regulation of membrane protease activity
MLASMVGLDVTARRRWIGALLLLAAMAMLVAGETLLKGRLRGLAFLLYWLLCFIFTGAAIIVAWLDARAVHSKSRREARELIEKTLGKIESDVRERPHRNRAEEDNS